MQPTENKVFIIIIIIVIIIIIIARANAAGNHMPPFFVLKGNTESLLKKTILLNRNTKHLLINKYKIL